MTILGQSLISKIETAKNKSIRVDWLRLTNWIIRFFFFLTWSMFNETFFFFFFLDTSFLRFIQSLAWVIFFLSFFSKIEKRKTGKKNYNNFSFSRPVSKRQGSIDNLYIHYTPAKLVPEWIFLLFLRTSHVFSFNVALMKKKKRKEKKKIDRRFR